MALVKECEHLHISLQDIQTATKNFTTLIGRGGFGNVYKGELSLFDTLTPVAVKRLNPNISGQGLKEFLTEIHLLSRYKHPNLVSLLGFCQEGNEKILVYEYAEHGSLDRFLTMNSTECPLTCKQKIDICIDAACGLDFLHNHAALDHRVIHRDIKSSNILLDHNWKAMISDLGLSKLGRANEKDTFLVTNPCGTRGYCDPVYINTGILTKESDVYSFGVVLLEVLCGKLGFMIVNNERRLLASLAQQYYREGKLHDIVDPVMKVQLEPESLNKVLDIAYQCLHDDRENRPSMGLVVKKLKQAFEVQDYEVSFGIHEIKTATKNFTTLIGNGNFGKVYKGEVSLLGALTTVAVKRLDARYLVEGFDDFSTKFRFLSQYKHPNLVSLLGFCQEGNEKILVYEYAEHGSLDKFLGGHTTLTAKQKINICIEAALGLEYLHNHVLENHRLVSANIKTSNILLDHNWKAMISDIEPIYDKYGGGVYALSRTGICLYDSDIQWIGPKESDVHSFGVVLFEVLCGSLYIMNVNFEQRFLVPFVQRYYEEGKIRDIIDPVMKEQLHSGSLSMILDIAYQCLHNNRRARPSMGLVVKKLKEAFELLETNREPIGFEEINITNVMSHAPTLEYDSDNDDEFATSSFPATQESKTVKARKKWRMLRIILKLGRHLREAVDQKRIIQDKETEIDDDELRFSRLTMFLSRASCAESRGEES